MTIATRTLDQIIADGYIDVRDLIARLEYVEDSEDADEIEERDEIDSILADLKGYGGDEQWRGDWYPITLIPDSDFEDYAQDLADDTGAIDRNATWPMTHIDWEAAARELKQDYSECEIRGVTYQYR